MLKVLMAFHHRAARRIMGMMVKHGAGREWEYPAVEEAMESVGLHPIGVYIKRRHTTTAERWPDSLYMNCEQSCRECQRQYGWCADGINKR